MSVNVAVSVGTIKKYAVAVGELFEAFADADFANKVSFKLFDFHLQSLSQVGDFLLVDPHVSRGARAAVTTSGALELQAVFVPGFFVSFFGH